MQRGQTRGECLRHATPGVSRERPLHTAKTEYEVPQFALFALHSYDEVGGTCDVQGTNRNSYIILSGKPLWKPSQGFECDTVMNVLCGIVTFGGGKA